MHSAIFLVQKSSGKWRLICDLRKYNSRLQDYIVHLPSPYELINKICSFKLFSYCDYPDAYFNIPISQKSLLENPIVASVSGILRNVKYRRLPQGCKTSTGIFINILNAIYAKLQDFLFIFLDDSITCSGPSEEDHWKRLMLFFETT